MINKLGLLIFVLGSNHFVFFNIYNFKPEWKEIAYLILTCIGGIMYLYEGKEK